MVISLVRGADRHRGITSVNGPRARGRIDDRATPLLAGPSDTPSMRRSRRPAIRFSTSHASYPASLIRPDLAQGSGAATTGSPKNYLDKVASRNYR
ncbi:TPA: hypothetical protein QDC22_007911 [Burkholderia stabilis]|nr:hypothetical protein [Burkholderia stabilis]HDR9589659.1 hypothetical protein [Burkholderia stabilis]HDR9649244.1 hypothetical protein [Burkholderia stabilis]HDR9653979.1 hypothetical protein [Burkholderia stabilis]HDR9679486.1 hypothetical protein [Burkholderia stabilis]